MSCFLLGMTMHPVSHFSRSRSSLLLLVSATAFLVLLGLFSPVGTAAPSTSPSPGSASASSESTIPAEPGASEGVHGHVGEAGHEDPFSNILLGLTIVVLAAVVGRWLAIRIHQPSVLGELLIGVLLGNLGYWLQRPVFVLVMHLESVGEVIRIVFNRGLTIAEAAGQVFSEAELAGGLGVQIVQILSGPGAGGYLLMAAGLWIFSNLGVILLLFMVGLESTVEEMLQVGPRALMVALVGIAAPFFLGWGASVWLLPQASTPAHLFIGATLCATSVGITARVFKDLNKIQSRQAKLILGAAVIDDVLGLVILAVVAGIVTTGEFSLLEVGRILLVSVLFLGLVMVFGDYLVRRSAPLFGRMERRNLKLLYPLILAFALAWAASGIGLASIVGAFAAGLILHEKHFEAHTDARVPTVETIAPLEAVFAPVFFVLMGMQVNLSTFLEGGTLWLALALIVAAVAGKLVAGFPAGKQNDPLSVGIGMVPRGEVGLIFASIGKGLGVVSGEIFSAVVMMVIVTTLLTPLALQWSLRRRERMLSLRPE